MNTISDHYKMTAFFARKLQATGKAKDKPGYHDATGSEKKCPDK